MSRLAVFDVDGTLTDTMGVDNECYRAAVAQALELDEAAIDWKGAAHVTDAGIFEWLCAAHQCEHLAASAGARARADFIERLRTALDVAPERFTAIPGAPNAIRRLPDSGWSVAFATGGWGPSAKMKLRAADIPVNDVVFACADDAVTRADIVRLAIARAEQHHDTTFDRIVVLGDAPWDVRAAIELDLPFVGVGDGPRAERLWKHGAQAVIADYGDFAAFLDTLASARPPVVPAAK